MVLAQHTASAPAPRFVPEMSGQLSCALAGGWRTLGIEHILHMQAPTGRSHCVPAWHVCMVTSVRRCAARELHKVRWPS